MRIAIVSTPFIRVPPAGYGGTELFCYELAEELHARGHDVTLFATGDSEVSCRKRWLYPCPAWPPHPHDEIAHLGWALSDAARGGFDVVHINSPLGIPLGRFLDAPVVHTLHHHRDAATSRPHTPPIRASPTSPSAGASATSRRPSARHTSSTTGCARTGTRRAGETTATSSTSGGTRPRRGRTSPSRSPEGRACR